MKLAKHNTVLVALALVGAAGCSSNKSSLAPLDSIGATNVAVITVSTGPASTSGGNLTTIPSTTGANTTTTTPSAGPPCTFEAIHADVGTAVAGITDIDLRCEGDWASWIGQPADPTQFDGYFAVAQRSATAWTRINLGTAGVCSDGGVPAELWTALNCTE